MQNLQQEYYQAMVDKNLEYFGVFFVGVKTTGIFCRPGCPARTPKFENCEFYDTAQEALLAGFRPCKRCHPLSNPNQVPEIVQKLVDAVEAHPEKKWHSEDVRSLYIDPSTARRQFKKRFGMTFIEYARSRRIGMAMTHIRAGKTVIDAQVTSGYESGSGFRDAVTRIIGSAPSLAGEVQILRASWIDTRLGPMIAIADDEALYLLEFVDRRGLEREIEKLRTRTKSAIIPGCTPPISQIERELADYFAGQLRAFRTPVACVGTDFQQLVWNALQQIPSGETRSYSQIAACIGNPSAVRAVARANGANQLAIVIPCHRVIGANGDLTGYAGGLTRKKWLINHEKAGA